MRKIVFVLFVLAIALTACKDKKNRNKEVVTPSAVFKTPQVVPWARMP